MRVILPELCLKSQFTRLLLWIRTCQLEAKGSDCTCGGDRDITASDRPGSCAQRSMCITEFEKIMTSNEAKHQLPFTKFRSLN